VISESTYHSQISPWLRNIEHTCQDQSSSQEAMQDALVLAAERMQPKFHLEFAKLQQQMEHILLGLQVDSRPKYRNEQG
jgi:hypothetical protein